MHFLRNHVEAVADYLLHRAVPKICRSRRRMSHFLHDVRLPGHPERAEYERLVRLGEEVIAELKAMHRANLAEHTKLVTLVEKLQG